ncbi:MAG: hypothetical protein AB1344_07410 [Pseudomonadota bacterium]
MNLFSFTQQQPPRERDAVSLPPSLLRGGAALFAVFLAICITPPDSQAARSTAAVSSLLIQEAGLEGLARSSSDHDTLFQGGQRPAKNAQPLAILNGTPQPSIRTSAGMPDPAPAMTVVNGTLDSTTRALGEQLLGALQQAGMLGASR